MLEKELFLDFYGINFKIKGYSNIINNLGKDFQYFSSREKKSSYIVVNIIFKHPKKNILPKKKFYSRKDYSVYCKKNQLLIIYNKELLADYNNKNDVINLYSKNLDLLYEISYLFIHSKLGELLEIKSLNRIHAAGFTYNNEGYLFLANTGCGKSSLVLELLKDSKFKILSDDTPILNNQLEMLSFPIRMGVGKNYFLNKQFKTRILKRREYGVKKLIDIDNFKNKIVKKSNIKKIFLGEKSNKNKPQIKKSNIITSFKYLFVNLIIGYGTPQVLEFLIKPNIKDFFEKLQSIMKRFHLSIKLLNSCEFYVFYTVKDFKKNKQILEKYI